MEAVQILLIALLSSVFYIVSSQNEPVITTDENGGIRFSSGGDLVFETGGQFQFVAADGSMTNGVGQKGDQGDTGSAGPQGGPGQAGDPGAPGTAGRPGAAGDTGDTGAPGPQGVKGEKGERGEVMETAGGGGLIAWNQCSWANLNDGRNFGKLVECAMMKQRNDTWLKVTWNGNMRVANCRFCCMRWYFTINGEECSDPGPVDSILYIEQDIEILRQSHLTGICRAAGGTNITQGVIQVQFSVMDCPRFRTFVYDAYTGWNSVSRIIIEEIMPRDNTFPELLSPEPPPEFIFFPHYCQYFFTDLGNQQERNVGTVLQVKFKKEHIFSALKMTWEGNMVQRSCQDCCVQWWFSVNGARCTSFEDITTSIYSLNALNMATPTTLTGVCSEVNGIGIFAGTHTIKLEVGWCPGSFLSDAAAGLWSTSRVIIEEVLLAINPNVRQDVYHPNWLHCAIPANIPEGTRDSGPLDTLTCGPGSGFNKTSINSSLQITFNGNIRLTACSDCCMRWFLTINGQECTQPAPINAVIYNLNGSQVNIHRGSTITGVCEATAGGRIGMGPVEVKMNLGQCEGFNRTFDSYTSLESLSTIEIKELPPAVTTVAEKASKGFTPNWVQCVMSNLSSPATNSSVMSCSLTKREADSVMKVSWDGNMAVENCTDCCMRWYITIDDVECSDPGPIDSSIRIDSIPIEFDLRRPGTVSGICRGGGGGGGGKFPAGQHTFDLLVEPCTDLPSPSEVLTGYNSISRFIIEELPDQIDTECIITDLP